MKYNLPPFNEKVPRGFFEQTILDFSSGLFKNPFFGYALALLLNILYLYTYCKSKSCFSVLIYLFLAYLLSSLILAQIAQFKRCNKQEIKDDSISEEKLKTLFKEFRASIEYFKNFIKKTISLEDKLYTFITLFEFYLLMKITSFLNDKIILIFISNICIFYSIIDKKFPYFLFKCRMSIKQIIEGIIILLICIIPRYEEKEIEKQNENDKKQKNE